MLPSRGRATQAGVELPGSKRLGLLSTAIGLAVLSVPAVAWSLQLEPWFRIDNEGLVTPPVDWRPMGVGSAVILALITTVLAAVVSSAIGGWIARRRRVLGLFATLAIAWFAAVTVLPIAATLLGIHLRAAIVCLIGCEASINSGDPLSGLRAVLLVPIGVARFVPVLAIPAVVLMVGRKQRSHALVVLGVVLTHAVFYGLMLTPLVFGAHVPYVALVIGFAIWSYLVRDQLAPWPPVPPLDPANQYGPSGWNPPDGASPS